MSNDILGAIEPGPAPSDAADQFAALAPRTMLGLSLVPMEDLASTLERFLPSPQDREYVGFRVSDRPGVRNATYLVDGIDYADDNSIRLPARSADRITLFVDLVHDVFAVTGQREMYLAIMDSSQLDGVRDISLAEFGRTLRADMDRFAPPDVLYRIKR